MFNIACCLMQFKESSPCSEISCQTSLGSATAPSRGIFGVPGAAFWCCCRLGARRVQLDEM